MFFYALIATVLFVALNFIFWVDVLLGIALGSSLVLVGASFAIDIAKMRNFRRLMAKMKDERKSPVPEQKKTNEHFEPFRRHWRRRRKRRLAGFSEREQSFIITTERRIIGSMMLKIFLMISLVVLTVYIFALV